MFFYLDTKLQWRLDFSIHAFADDILLHARKKDDVQRVFEAIDGPARLLGHDMNVNKTELHLMRGAAHIDIHSQHGGRLSTRESTGRPHAVYKYLGVYFYTTDHIEKVFAFLKADIESFFAHLAPSGLTASGLIQLTNKQLIPTVSYRLLASPLDDSQLEHRQKVYMAQRGGIW